MINLLKKMWRLIVKTLTLGVSKGNKYVDSKTTPTDKIDEYIEKLETQKTSLRSMFFEVRKEFNKHTRRVEQLQPQLDVLRVDIREALNSSDQEKSKQLARESIQKEESIRVSEKRSSELDKRGLKIRSAVDRLTSDISILQDKRFDLETTMTMRDHSKLVSGDVDYGKTVDDILRSVETSIDDVEVDDQSWQDTAEAFSPETSEREKSEDMKVEEYLNSFKQ